MTALAALAAFASILAAPAEFSVSKAVIYTQPGASPVELHAAQELREYLSKIIGKELPLKTASSGVPKGSIIVGQGPAAAALFPEFKQEKLGQEQTFIKTKNGVLLVAGGKPRGTLYAVYRLLGEKCGVRWWAPWATKIPKNPSLSFPAMDWSEKPAFEYRDTFWFHAFDADWAARNYSNGFTARLDEARGGKVEYQGFVHTYYVLVPPDPYFAKRPEWFSLIDGKRTTEWAQLCTTNPELRDFVVEQVKAQLRANPKATIISVSQNDCFRPCQCDKCRSLANSEGSDSALVLDLANYVGEKIESEFPNVAVDTLAYQWSRKPPRTMRPRRNVVVRLCSIECNFAYGLNEPQNASFGDDLRGWGRLSRRTYIWDYCTDFAHYLQPHPDYYTLGPSIKFFAENGVKGVFEEGAYQSTNGEMAELKAWLIAQLLWDPNQDSNRLIKEFLEGYYGRAAGPIKEYMDLMAKEAKGWNLTFASPTGATFLRYEVVSKARILLNKAIKMVKGEELWRVRQLSASLDYVYLARWTEFRWEALVRKTPWLAPKTRTELAKNWLETITSTKDAPKGWTPVTMVNESGWTPQHYIEALGPEPAEPVIYSLPKRPAQSAPPEGLAGGIDVQDNLANLWNSPWGAELRPDPKASDGIACWMPGNHHEWAFQVPLSKIPNTNGRFKVYVVARIESGGPDGSPGFSAGVYDGGTRQEMSSLTFPNTAEAAKYKTYDLGTIQLNSNQYIWAAPTANPSVQAVWIDRVYLVKAD